jgi:hypothetical protein
MTIIRGIRCISEGYDRDFIGVPETDENASTCVILETNNEEDFSVKIANLWPDFISLDAAMIPTAILNASTIERVENGVNLGKMQIYNSPRIDTQSHIDNPKLCCAKIAINFENTGKYSLDSYVFSFHGASFDDYEIQFTSASIFEKNFLSCPNEASILEKYTVDSNRIPRMEHPDGAIKYQVYPYGGFFEYGAHPKQMESCIFRTSHDGRSLYLRISKISTLQSIGIDPTCDNVSEPGYRFVGVKDFSESQKINLYDELKNGACRIEVQNKSTEESCFYKSNAVVHIAKTNLISINFIKE